MARRLYVAGSGKDLIYCTAETNEEAQLALGPGYRFPDPDDIRRVWELGKLDQMSSAEVYERLGVRRQTVDYWFRKAGGNLPRRRERLVQEREERIRELFMDRKRRRTATEIARLAGAAISTVRVLAKKFNVKLSTGHKRPSDDELVRLATGKTWPELAAATGLRLSSLRSYIYARPELSARIAAVRKARPSGRESHGKVDPKKLAKLANKGLSAYAISLQLGVEQMVIRYWMRKLAQKGDDASASHRGPIADVMGSSDGGIARDP